MLNRIIIISLLLVFATTGASFFVEPKYEKGVWFGFAALVATLSGALGAKYAFTIPGAAKSDVNDRKKTILGADPDPGGDVSLRPSGVVRIPEV